MSRCLWGWMMDVWCSWNNASNEQMCSLKSWETIVIWPVSLTHMRLPDAHTRIHCYILTYSLPDLINHLIISAVFIGWRTCGTIIAENKFGLYDVGFGENQKGKPGNADGRALCILCLLSFCPSVSSSVGFSLSQTHYKARSLIHSPLSPRTFVSSHSTNWHDLGIMELGQRSHLY